jgi:hypothetical protein
MAFFPFPAARSLTTLPEEQKSAVIKFALYDRVRVPRNVQIAD